MSAEFDPYYKWLGIPPAEQPPNHYRLLGIQLCEPDLDVISNAADQRMAHIRTFQSGKYSTASQRLLNEISTARVLLLSTTKEQYDRNLQSAVASTDAQPAQKPLPKAKPLATQRADVPAAEPRSSDDANPIDNIVNVSQPSHDVVRRTAHAQRLWQNPVLLGVAGVLTLLVLCGVVYVLVRRGDDKSVAGQPEMSPANIAPAQIRPADPQATTPSPTNPAVAGPESGPPPVKAKPLPEETSDKPPVETVVDQSPVDPPNNPTDVPATDPPELVPITPTVIEATITKRRAPDAATKKRQRETITELFKAEIAGAKTDKDKLALAKTWIQIGNETNDDDAARYVLLQLAAQTAVNIGDVETAMAAIDGMDSYFDVDVWKFKIAALTSIAKARGTDFKERNQQVADVASGLIDGAVADGKFEAANELLNIALASARGAKEYSLVKELVVRKKEIDELAKAYQVAMEAFATLENDPADPAANLIAGRYLCFIKGDWARGLPFLAKGDNDELKSVAKMELAAPTTPAERSAVGDVWWDVAESEDEPANKHLFVRATDWYRAALPSLTGLDKTKVEQRLAELTNRFGESTNESAKVVGVVIDVLAEVDIERDRIHGEWSMRDDGLCMHKGQRAKLPFPVIPTGDFELTVEFTLLDKNQIGFIFPLNPSTAVFWTDGAYEGYQLTNNPDGGQYILKKKPSMPLFGGRRELYLKVSKTADELYNISIALQGEPIIAWKGPASELFRKPGYELPFDAISMSNWDAGAVFHSIKLRPLSGDVLRIMQSKAAIGNWNIKYADGARRSYRFDENGSVFFVEVNRRGRLLKAGNGDVLLDFNDGKLERLHLAGNTMRVDHFDPAGSYPKIVKLTAIGERAGN